MNAQIQIPSDFILANFTLSWGDLQYGLERSFIQAEDVLKIAEHIVSKKVAPDACEVEIAGLLQKEICRIPELLTLLTSNLISENNSKSKWLRLLLAWLYERRDSFDDPLELIECVYADFDYPEEMSCFVRYMPPTDD